MSAPLQQSQIPFQGTAGQIQRPPLAQHNASQPASHFAGHQGHQTYVPWTTREGQQQVDALKIILPVDADFNIVQQLYELQASKGEVERELALVKTALQAAENELKHKSKSTDEAIANTKAFMRHYWKRITFCNTLWLPFAVETIVNEPRPQFYDPNQRFHRPDGETEEAAEKRELYALIWELTDVLPEGKKDLLTDSSFVKRVSHFCNVFLLFLLNIS